MEAAHIPWRPLGRLLVEQGLLTDQELDFALLKQQTTGRRLGETIVECGFVSPPDLSNALAAQYGIELIAETGFGTGLRAQIQRRHESDRGRPALTSIPDLQQAEEEVAPDPGDASPPPAEEMLLAQLEEQWAKLAAAEEWLAEREVELAVLAADRDRRQAQAERLLHRARAARTELTSERERREELAALSGSADGLVQEQQARLGAAEERLSERERELALLTADRDRRRAQAVRIFARLRTRELEYRHTAQALRDEMAEQGAKLAAADELLSERERDLAALAAERDRRREQVARFVRRVRARDGKLVRLSEEMRTLRDAADGLRDQAERLAGDVRGCDAEIERLRRENEGRRAQAARFAARLRAQSVDRAEQGSATPPPSHLVFVQLTTGYEVVERAGAPPPRHSPLELPDLCDGSLVVARSRPSPFPGDARPCVVAEER